MKSQLPNFRSTRPVSRLVSNSLLYRLATRAAHPRTQVATLTLLSLLQKSPAITRTLNSITSAVNPATSILQKITVAAASLGSYHAVSGATTAVYVTNPSLPLNINQGEPFSFAFAVQNTQAAAQSWTFTGTLPAGLVVSGRDDEPIDENGVFNAQFGKITGTPTEAGAFVFTLQPWKNRNASGNTAEALEVNMTVNAVSSNTPPSLATAIPDQSAEVGKPFSFDYGSHFTDPDAGDTLSFGVELANGSDLPDWLQNSGGVLSGTPAESDIGTVSIRAIASDAEASVDDTFELTVNEARIPVAPLAVIRKKQGNFVVSWQIQEDQTYSIETSAHPSSESTWQPIEAVIETVEGTGSATLDPDSLPDSVFIRVATEVQ